MDVGFGLRMCDVIILTECNGMEKWCGVCVCVCVCVYVCVYVCVLVDRKELYL